MTGDLVGGVQAFAENLVHRLSLKRACFLMTFDIIFLSMAPRHSTFPICSGASNPAGLFASPFLHIPSGLSVSSFENRTYEKMTCGSFAADSSFNLVAESSVSCSPFSRDQISRKNVQLPSYLPQSLESPCT